MDPEAVAGFAPKCAGFDFSMVFRGSSRAQDVQTKKSSKGNPPALDSELVITWRTDAGPFLLSVSFPSTTPLKMELTKGVPTDDQVTLSWWFGLVLDLNPCLAFVGG